MYQPTLTHLVLLSETRTAVENVIHTLDPNKFAEKEQRRLQIGSVQHFRLHVSLLRQASPVEAGRMEREVTRYKGTRTRHPFPPNTKAFLYYSRSPEKPRIAGELRLRVASSDDLASFESGSDLLLTNGRAWRRPIYTLSSSKYYGPLYEKLREERFIPDDLDAVLSNLPSKRQSYRRTQFLFTLNDTFIVDFAISIPYCLVITEQAVESIPLAGPFLDNRGVCRAAPYTGPYANHHLFRYLDS